MLVHGNGVLHGGFEQLGSFFELSNDILNSFAGTLIVGLGVGLLSLGFLLGTAALVPAVFFEKFLARLGDAELVDDQEPAYRPANFVSGYEAMPIRFTPAVS